MHNLVPKARYIIYPTQAQCSVGTKTTTMKRTILSLMLCLSLTSLYAQTEAELNAWNDVNVYEINRLYPRTNVIPVGEQWSQCLNGDWKF